MKKDSDRYKIWTKFILEYPIFAIEDKPIEITEKQLKQREATKRYRDKKKSKNTSS